MNHQELSRTYANLLEQVDDFALFRDELESMELKDFEAVMLKKLESIRFSKMYLWSKIDLALGTESEGKNCKIKDNGTYGLSLVNGTKIIEGYEAGRNYYCDRARVMKKDSLWYYFDTEGNELFGGFDTAWNFRDDKALVRKPNENLYTIDLNGNEIVK